MFVLYLLGFLLWRPWRQQCTGSLKRRHSAFVSVRSGPWPLEGSVPKCCELHTIWKLVSSDFGLLADDLDSPPPTVPSPPLQFADAEAYFAPCTTDTTGNNCLVRDYTAEKIPAFSFSSNSFSKLRSSIFHFKPCVQLHMILKTTMNKPTFSWQKSFGWVEPILSQIQVDHELF